MYLVILLGEMTLKLTRMHLPVVQITSRAILGSDVAEASSQEFGMKPLPLLLSGDRLYIKLTPHLRGKSCDLTPLFYEV